MPCGLGVVGFCHSIGSGFQCLLLLGRSVFILRHIRHPSAQWMLSRHRCSQRSVTDGSLQSSGDILQRCDNPLGEYPSAQTRRNHSHFSPGPAVQGNGPRAPTPLRLSDLRLELSRPAGGLHSIHPRRICGGNPHLSGGHPWPHPISIILSITRRSPRPGRLSQGASEFGSTLPWHFHS